MKKFKTLLLLMVILPLCIACEPNEESKAWDTAQKLGTTSAMDTFLARYPNTSHRGEAQKIKEDLLWQYALLNNTRYYYSDYINKYPEGKHKKQAQLLKDSLEQNQGISLSELTENRFTGYVKHHAEDLEILSMRFTQIQDKSTGIAFVADITLSSNLRKQLPGHIDLSTSSIEFFEKEEDDFFVQLGKGAIYRRNGNILIESVELGNYWSLKNK